MQKYEFIKIIDHHAVSNLVLNRPSKCNAMNAQFFDEFQQAILAIEKNTYVRAIVISGEGKHFTTGADVNYLVSIMDGVRIVAPEKREQHLFETIKKMQIPFNTLANCSKPTIAAIHGLCIGAGVDLISACDIRLATKSSHYSIMETKLGIPADLGTLQRLPYIMSDGHLKELAFTSKIFSAHRGVKWGLLNKTFFTKKGLLKSAIALAKECCDNPFYAVKTTKETINFIHQQQIREGLNNIARLNSQGLQSEEMAKMMDEMKAKFAK